MATGRQRREGPRVMKSVSADIHAPDAQAAKPLEESNGGGVGRASRARSMTMLWALRPFLTRYKFTLIAAAISLVAAAGATLVLPVAVRRMIDFGFTGENSALINSYFGMLLLVAAVLAAASA